MLFIGDELFSAVLVSLTGAVCNRLTAMLDAAVACCSCYSVLEARRGRLPPRTWFTFFCFIGQISELWRPALHVGHQAHLTDGPTLQHLELFR